MSTLQESKENRISKLIIMSTTILGSILGVLAIIVTISVFTTLDFTFISTDRISFYILSGIGLTMCMVTFPIRSNFQKKFKWTSLLSISSIILGAAATTLFILVLLNVPISFVTNEKIAIVIMGSIILVKWIISTLHLFVKN